VVAAQKRGSEDLLGGADTQLSWRAATAAGLGLDSFWACGCGSCVLCPGGLLRRRAGTTSPLFPAGGMGAASLDRIMAAVLGFLSRQDKDLSNAYLH
jgi:hypothetical protein